MANISAWCLLRSADLEALCDMLTEITVDFEQNNIPHFLCMGSLLGSVRQGGHIPWEHDIDLCVPRSLRPNVTSILTGPKYAGLLLPFPQPENRNLSKALGHVMIRRAHARLVHLWIDVYWYDVENSEGDLFISGARQNRGDIWPGQYVWPLVPRRYCGSAYWGPHEAEPLLEREYGQNWRTPKFTGTVKSRTCPLLYI
jgi:hypothetical protein